MEILGTCFLNEIPLETFIFSIDNDSEQTPWEFQRQMVDRWRSIFKSSEIGKPRLLSQSRDCRVYHVISSVGALWRKYAFVLLPKEPLPRGKTSHPQRLLAVKVGATERLTVDELAGRVRATYGPTALLHNQRLLCYEGGGRDCAGSADCQGAFYFVLEEEAPVKVDAAEVEKEENRGGGRSVLVVPHNHVSAPLKKSLLVVSHNPVSARLTKSLLVVSHNPVSARLTKNLPRPSANRHCETIGRRQLTLPAKSQCSLVPFEPELGDIPQTSDGKRTSSAFSDYKPCPEPVPREMLPTGKVSLKESIKLVAAYQSLKERPEEYLPPVRMIHKKTLDKYFFGYSAMPDLLAVNEEKRSSDQEKKDVLGKGGNGVVYKASYKGRVFAVKETKYRPNEIQKWKMMCHPNLLPLLALQCHFHQVGPVEECAVEASCWAFMPIMDVDLRSILSDLEPLVVRMGTATPSEAATMMANAKHVLREILKGLQALHDLGLVHRDIKEHNILISVHRDCQDVFACACPRERKCEVVIADFDSIAEEGAKHCSRHVLGTYGYHAPEAYTSATVSSSLDVWGFGVIATKVFLGRNLDEQKRDAATLSFKQQNAAEVLVPQLLLKDLLSHGSGDLHEAAMFVRECLEVDGNKRKTASALLNLPFMGLHV